jgi:diguanylate cyclase (GGDEF)-like protein
VFSGDGDKTFHLWSVADGYLHGHAFGDRVLQIIARRLRKSTRPSDLLARLGGDEFALLCYDVDRDTALAIGRRFIASLEGEIRAGGHLHIIGASIGIVLIPDDGANAEEVIHHADLAMYRAKGQDRSSVVFFEPTAQKWSTNNGRGQLLEPPAASVQTRTPSGQRLRTPDVSQWHLADVQTIFRPKAEIRNRRAECLLMTQSRRRCRGIG